METKIDSHQKNTIRDDPNVSNTKIAFRQNISKHNQNGGSCRNVRLQIVGHTCLISCFSHFISFEWWDFTVFTFYDKFFYKHFRGSPTQLRKQMNRRAYFS